MGFLKPKTIVMPAAAAAPPPPAPTPPPASIEQTFKDDSGKATTAKAEAEKKIEKKQAGMTKTIMTGPKGVTDEATIYTPTLLG